MKRGYSGRNAAVGIEKFDAVNAPIRSKVDLDLVRKLNRLDFAGLFVQSQMGDVVARIVSYFILRPLIDGANDPLQLPKLYSLPQWSNQPVHDSVKSPADPVVLRLVEVMQPSLKIRVGD